MLSNASPSPGAPTVMAVLDWELSTLGDPLADFSYHMMAWHMPRSEAGADTGSLVGLDLAAAVPQDAPVTLAPGERGLIATGFAIAPPDGFEAQVRPRSGLAARHGVTVLNTPGTIDADYRGEIQVILINLGSEPFIVTRGMRVAQLVIAPVARAGVTEVAKAAH